MRHSMFDRLVVMAGLGYSREFREDGVVDR